MQPGQFFTEVLDSVSDLKRSLNSNDFKAAQTYLNAARYTGMLFALPEHGRLKDRTERLSVVGDILKPPYPVCILEFSGFHNPGVPIHARSSRRVVIAVDKGTYVELATLSYSDAERRWYPLVCKFKLFYGDEPTCIQTGSGLIVANAVEDITAGLCEGLRVTQYKGSKEAFHKHMVEQNIDEFWAYTDFCRTLHENETTFTDVEPDSAANRSRRLRGKAPLFTYKVLTIGGPKRKSKPQGGTHASPRSHLRRGCYRTSPKGIRHWVQPCMVKGGTDGFVHKDYNVVGTA